MISYKRKNSFSKKKVFIIVLALLMVATGVIYFIWNKKQNSTTESKPQPDTTINYNPPTTSEKQQADVAKEKVVERDKKDQAANELSSAGQTVKAMPIINDASQYGENIEIRAFVQNVYEDTGRCNYIIKNEQYTVTKQTNAIKAARTTNCETLTIPRSEFKQAGKWQVTVSYSSSSASGTSEAAIMEIK